MSLGEFAGNFLTAFQNAKRQKALDDQDAKERKAHLTLFELQLQREQDAQRAAQEQSDAQTQLFQRLQGTPQSGPPGNLVALPGKPPQSLTDLLADPQGASLLLKSGLLKGEDLLRQNENNANRTFTQGIIDRAQGGGGGGMELQGYDVGPNGMALPKFGLPAITTQVVQTPNGPRIKSFNSRTGQEVANLGAPQEQPLNSSDAGRVTGINQGLIAANALESSLIKPDGSVDRTSLFTSFGNPFGGGIPFTQGRTNASGFEDAKDAILRVTSGAGLSKQEGEGIALRFQPNLLDKDQTIVNKITRLKAFLNGSFEAAGIPPSIREKLIKARGAQGQQSAGSSGGRIIDFHDLK